MTSITVPDFFTGLGSFSTYNGLIPITSLFTSSESFIDGQVMQLFMTGKIQTQGIVYTGIMTTLIMSFISAAYVIYKTVDAAVTYTSSSIQAYYFRYGAKSQWGNYLGVYELVAIFMFEGWAFFLSMFSLWFAFDLWKQVEDREIGYKTEGRGGEVVDIIQAMKMFTLCIIVGLTALIGAFSMGDSAP